MPDQTKPDEDTEAIRQAGSTPEDGDQSTHPRNWPGIPSPSGEGEVPDADSDEERLEEELPSNRAQERGGP